MRRTIDRADKLIVTDEERKRREGWRVDAIEARRTLRERAQRAAAEALLRTAGVSAEPLLVPSDSDPREAEIQEAIGQLDAAVSKLEAVATLEGNGRLATWARTYGSRVAKEIRAMRIPWSQPPRAGGTIIARLVWNADVEKRDILGIGRPLTDGELGCVAVLRGYLPNADRDRSGLSGDDVLVYARKAINSQRKKTPGF